MKRQSCSGHIRKQKNAAIHASYCAYPLSELRSTLWSVMRS